MSRTAWRVIGAFAAVVIIGGAVAAVWLTVAEKHSQSAAVDARIEANAASAEAPATATAPTADDRFFADLDRMSVPYAQNRKNLVIEDGHYYCSGFKLGDSYRQMLTDDSNDQYSDQKITAAVDAYCPEYKRLLN